MGPYGLFWHFSNHFGSFHRSVQRNAFSVLSFSESIWLEKRKAELDLDWALVRMAAITSQMNYSTVASEDRTSEWILTEGGQKQISRPSRKNSGNFPYQKPWQSNNVTTLNMAPGTAATSGQNGSAISKLNPECKPFSPTRKYNNKRKFRGQRGRDSRDFRQGSRISDLFLFLACFLVGKKSQFEISALATANFWVPSQQLSWIVRK